MIELTIHLDEQNYEVLSRYAQASHREVEAVVNELLAEQLADLSLRLEAERIRALSLAERRALARGAWGSWVLANGTNSVDLVRQSRAEWTT